MTHLNKMEVDDDDAVSVASQRSRGSGDLLGNNTSAQASKRGSRRGSPVPLMSDEEVFKEIDMKQIVTSPTSETPAAARPLEILVRAASMMNPKQFELPSELQCHMPLPGKHTY